jgi:hypothetical protein
MKDTNPKTKVSKQVSKNWVLPGKTISNDEFMAGINESEKGPFHSVQESMENFEQWMKSPEKK